MRINKFLVAAVLATAAGTLIGSFVGDFNMAQPTTPTDERAPFFHGLGNGPIANQSGLASLERADAWLNSPLATSALRGKVVLVDFWTYTCINWLRTLPFVRAWAGKYKDKGLVVIGVHTPEFRFEKNIDNVRRASVQLKVDYPVAVDSEHAVWRAFANQSIASLCRDDSCRISSGASVRPKTATRRRMSVSRPAAIRSLPVSISER